MKFITTDSKVKCIRENAGQELHIAEFDIDVNQVAPHVAAVLSSAEISELEEWLAARDTLQTHLATRPNEKNIIGILPELMYQATQAVNELGYIDQQVRKDLLKRAAELTAALNGIRVVDEKRPTQINRVGKTETLKEKLDMLKKQL